MDVVYIVVVNVPWDIGHSVRQTGNKRTASQKERKKKIRTEEKVQKTATDPIY